MPPRPSSNTSSTAATAAATERRPLAEEILSAGQIRPKAPKQKSNKRKSRHEEDTSNPYIDARASRKILNLGQDLADEEAAEARAAGLEVAGDNEEGKGKGAAFEFDYSKFASREEDEDDDEGEYVQGGDEWADEEEEVEDVVFFNSPLLSVFFMMQRT